MDEKTDECEIVSQETEDQEEQTEEQPSENEDEKKDKPSIKKSKSKKNKNRGTVMTEEELARTGILYLSRIPTLMNKDILRRYFENFGEVERIWLELDTKAPQRGKRIIFEEGWVEFKDKRIAKRVAQCLNNTQVGGKKRYAWSEEIWNIKYLNRFKWVHLHERLSYEKAVHQQRMRTEISQAKRETNFYIENAEKSEYLRKKDGKKRKQRGKEEESKETKDETTEEKSDKVYSFKMKDTEEEIVGQKRKRAEKYMAKNKKNRKAKKEESVKPEGLKKPKGFLTKIFGGSAGE